MATIENICNIALSRLGLGLKRQIGNFNDDATTEADFMRLHYPMARDMLLRSHPWNFAIKRADLASDVTAPTFEYTYRFTLPVDCLRVLRTEAEATGPDNYRIENGYLLSDNDAVAIEYIARVTPDKFDPVFSDVLAQYLAAEAAMPLINDANVARGAQALYASKLRDARSFDAQEGTPRELVSAYSWLEARH